MMKSNSYMTRALQASDPRYAQVLGKLGYDRADIQAAPVDDLKAARDEYEAVIGKRAYHAWDAATLRAKIAEHKAG
jgi:hypothetical protein